MFPNIPVVYPGMFPPDFVNYIPGWGGFDHDTVVKDKGKMLMMDLDFGDTCSLNCPHCFRRSPRFDHGRNNLSFEETCDLIYQAKALGLKEVKILGAGEPFQDRRIVEFLRFLDSQEIFTAVFSKGHVFADDHLCQVYHGHTGINSGDELAKTLFELKVSILIGFNSLEPEIQDQMVGGIAGHTKRRNKSIEILARTGFNQSNPTRLGLGCSLTTIANCDQMAEIYSWARRRNFYPIICPTMISGRCGDEASWRQITPNEDELVDLYTQIYQFNLEFGLQTWARVQDEGISAYAGSRGCGQIGFGPYVTIDGTVHVCPGDDVTILGNVRDEQLASIWYRSVNYKRPKKINYGCPAKVGRSIPSRLFKRVLENLERNR